MGLVLLKENNKTHLDYLEYIIHLLWDFKVIQSNTTEH